MATRLELGALERPESGNVGVVEQKMCRLPSFVDISI